VSKTYRERVEALMCDPRAETVAAKADAEIQEKDAEIAALKADAARYRWLRKHAIYFGHDDRKTATPWCVLGTRYEDANPVHGEQLDSEVDAAIDAHLNGGEHGA
jgi:hypothetical protein